MKTISLFCINKKITLPRRGGSTALPCVSIADRRARSAGQSKCRSHFYCSCNKSWRLTQDSRDCENNLAFFCINKKRTLPCRGGSTARSDVRDTASFPLRRNKAKRRAIHGIHATKNRPSTGRFSQKVRNGIICSLCPRLLC